MKNNLNKYIEAKNIKPLTLFSINKSIMIPLTKNMKNFELYMLTKMQHVSSSYKIPRNHSSIQETMIN